MKQSLEIIHIFKIEVTVSYSSFNMAKKGKEKNTKNKSKHSKLMAQKKNKQTSEKELRKQRLREIVQQGKEPKK